MASAVNDLVTGTGSASGRPLRLHADRFFDADPATRRAAREIYEDIRDLPLVCPHGHVDPALLAENSAFPEPTALLIIPDHYIFRMLYSQGVPLEDIGVPTRDGSPVEGDPRKIWQRVADHWYLFRGTPSGAWLAHELHELFGVRQQLDGSTAQRIYDEIAEKLVSPEFRPRALFEQFRIEMIATTDAATDPLTHHRTIRESDWAYGRRRVIPCFRPERCSASRSTRPGRRSFARSSRRVA
jgi:Glucuronate isomerase